MTRMPLAAIPLALAAAGLAGCGSAPPPPDLARAQQAVQTAQQQNAAAYAPQAMQAAKDRLAAAQQAVNNDRPSVAKRMAQEALVNAELAQARVAQAQSQQALMDVHRAAGVSAPSQAALPPEQGAAP